MGQEWPGSQTPTPVTPRKRQPCKRQKVLTPACHVQMMLQQLQLFSLLCPLSPLEYKDLAGSWPVDLLKAVSLISLNRTAAKTAVWSPCPGFCHQPGGTLALPELCAVGDTEASAVLGMKVHSLHTGLSLTYTWAVHTHVWNGP